MAKHHPGTVLGADGAGTVVAAGEGADDLHAGDRVYAYSYDNPEGGFYAEYVSVLAGRAARIPPQSGKTWLAHTCVALTALAGSNARSERDQVLLVFGASGGVGSLGVWLGSGMKAKIVGTADPDALRLRPVMGAAT